jgi:ABC-type amino acid transport system permease subunit
MQYVSAARVCGLSPREIALDIQLPIVLRQLLPGLLTLQVAMLQATLFASLISVDEIFRVAQRINAQVYRPVPVYTALGLFFLIICLPLNGLALWLRRRYTRDLSEN